MSGEGGSYVGRHGDGASEVVTDDLLAAAREWIDDDPDPQTRGELHQLVDLSERGGPVAAAARAEIADRFSGMLEFGTAGLRGTIGAGPRRMNRAVVIRAAAGLAAWLLARHDAPDRPTVVVGLDARRRSDDFARDTAAVLTAAGCRAIVLPRPLPTPVLAFAIRHLGADAGVMVTASHNPKDDNGYKVYLGDGSQIVPPVDVEIAGRIAAVARVADVPRADDGWEVAGDDVLDAYLERAVAVTEFGAPREVTVVHTALHGVGGETVRRAFAEAGFPEPVAVTEQAQPDPAFPTVAFPNPEEDGALDLALARAREIGADLVVASDPDADRCAAAVPDARVEGGWRLLRGDELGALLASHLIVRGVPDGGVLACSIVSSRLLASMAAQVGVRHVETLTGFKWIARVEGLHYGYEEALGYCVAPEVVRDKDGITAALLVAELAAILKSQGRSLLDVLDDLAQQHGVHATDAFSVRVDDLALIATVMDRLRATPPTELAGTAVTRVDDLRDPRPGADGAVLPPTEGLRWFLEDGTRVIVRPSGTEPKLKVYLEAIEPVVGREDLAAARGRADDRLRRVRSATAALTRV